MNNPRKLSIRLRRLDSRIIRSVSKRGYLKSLISKRPGKRLCSRDCPDSTPFLSCFDCSFKCVYKDTLVIHMRQTHLSFEEGGGAYRCTICRYNTRAYGSMEWHLSAHEHDKNPNAIFLRCELCRFETLVESRMTQHRDKIHELKPVIVRGQCNSKLKSKLVLKYSLLKHKSFKKGLVYRCKQCSYKTAIKTKLWKHRRGHVRPVFCCNSCAYKSYSHKRIKEHIFLPHE